MTDKEILQVKEFTKMDGFASTTYEKIMNTCTIRQLRPKTSLLMERHPGDEIYFILEGVISIYRMNSNGTRKVIFMLNEGNFVNEDIKENSYNSCISADVFEKATLLCIPKQIFEELMEEDIMFMKKMYSSLSCKLRRTYRQLKNTPNSIKLDKRIASKLYKFGRDYGVNKNEGIEIDMDISITYLADLLGAQRETVSRSLKELTNLGLLTYHHRRFFIPNLENLAKYFKSL